MSPLLQVEGLHVDLPMGGVPRTVIHDVSLSVHAGEALGLVGESGSGKSMTLRAIVRLLPAGARVDGVVRLDGAAVHELDAKALRRLRSHDVAVIHQDPRAHINPVRTVGDFLTEGLVTTQGVRRREAEDRVVAILDEVGVDGARRRLRQRPHELSGGLLQRVMIAAALASGARLILADEPTTALDVTTQEEVVAILDEQRRGRGLALVFVTHDLELAAAVCDRTAVMYAGSIVEEATSAALHEHAAHPYTVALLGARPGFGHADGRLRTIPGRPLSAFEAPDGCAFADRCPQVFARCRAERPVLRPVPGGVAACHVAERVASSPAEEVLDA
jgi:oligopeptide/dipeptide ABC transporter ATP-binding protein